MPPTFWQRIRWSGARTVYSFPPQEREIEHSSASGSLGRPLCVVNGPVWAARSCINIFTRRTTQQQGLGTVRVDPEPFFSPISTIAQNCGLGAKGAASRNMSRAP